MSTILKALEKLEREKEALRATGPMPAFSVPGSAGGPSGWYLKPWLWLGLVGVIIMALGGTAWHFYRQSRGYAPRPAQRSASMDRPAAQHPADARNQAPPARIPEATRPEPRQPVRSSHSERRPAPPPGQAKPALQQETTAGSPAGIPDSAIQRPSPESAPATEGPAIKEAREKVETPPTGSPAPPDAAPKSNAPADVYENTPLLTDGRLRVHAIAWAPQPAERMAVINSRVLHEGDSVEDFVVVVIRPDDVVVREKGKSVWRVEFGRP